MMNVSERGGLQRHLPEQLDGSEPVYQNRATDHAGPSSEAFGVNHRTFPVHEPGGQPDGRYLNPLEKQLDGRLFVFFRQ